ncbi:MAG: fumarate hydratase C-terminal domain-containing protein [Oscillospiraceae bacterium]|nr:fumarate hydratase C-terminal domain-containing protein [Oscillospiraceae bacterium]
MQRSALDILLNLCYYRLMKSTSKPTSLNLNSPSFKAEAAQLSPGTSVLLSGTCYLARDAAHKRLFELLESGLPLPFELSGAAIYYCGPTETPPGGVIGAAGPTTSSRMDKYTPRLLEAGLCAIIGKGARAQYVDEAVARHGAVYFTAVGGAGAVLSQRIISSEIVAFAELGAEAVRRVVLSDFPATVAQNGRGSIFGH